MGSQQRSVWRTLVKSVTLSNTTLSTAYADLSGRYLVRAYSNNWSGVTATPKADINGTQVVLKDALGNTISFTANNYAIFEFDGRVTFAGAVGAGKEVTLEFVKL